MKEDALMLKKETSRYRLNSFISSQPIDKILYQPDVSKRDLPAITSSLTRLLNDNTITLIVVQNHTQRKIL